MALDVKVGSFSSASGVQTIAVGFQPKALIFFTRAKYGANDHMISHGLATGVNNQGSAASCGDYYSGYDRGGISNTHAIWLISNDPATREQGRVSAIGATGFDITWDTFTSSRTIYYVALGGSDLTNAAAGAFIYNGSANYAEAGLGFQPDCLLGLGYCHDDSTALTFGSTPRPVGITTGFALSPTNQHSFGAQSAWNSDADSTSGHKTGQFIVIPARSSGTRVETNLQSFDTGGFTLAKGAGTYDVGIVYLALKGLQYNIGINQQPTTTGDQALTGFGFAPQLVLAHHAGNANADGVFTEPEARGFGAGDGTVMGAVSQVSQLNSYRFGSRLDTAQIITACAVGDAAVASASLKSLDADGITLNWNTVDTVARNFGLLAIGPAGSGGPVLKSATDTLDISISESITILAALSSTDTLDLSIAESQPLIAVMITASDTADLSITDASTLAASLQAADAIDLSITDIRQALLSRLSSSDSLDLSLSEAAAILSTLQSSDTLNIGITDAVGLISIVLSANDNIDLSVTDIAGAIKAILSGIDTLDLAVDDKVQALLSRLQRSDSLDINLIEAADLLVAAQALDALDISLDEAPAILTLLINAADSLSVSLTEVSLKTVITQAIGRLVGAISVKPAVGSSVDAKPAISASTETKPAVGGKVKIND